jgi:hypothetical protein
MKTIPQTDVLLEATLESLQEIYSMDPETWNERHIERIIAENRALRVRFEEADRLGKKSPKPQRLAVGQEPTAARRKKTGSIETLRALLLRRPPNGSTI